MHQGQILIPLLGAPQTDQATQLSPIADGLGQSQASSLALSLEFLSSQELVVLGQLWVSSIMFLTLLLLI